MMIKRPPLWLPSRPGIIRPRERNFLPGMTGGGFLGGGSGVPATTSYANAGGTGDRTSLITVSRTGGAAGAGSLSELVDGAFVDGFYFSGAARLTFDFGASNYKQIDEITWRQNGSGGGDGTHTHGTVWWRASQDGVEWFVLDGPFTLGGALASVHAVAATGGWRYYELCSATGGFVSTGWMHEVEFKIAETSAAAETRSAGETTASYANVGGSAARLHLVSVSTDLTTSGAITAYINGTFVNEHWWGGGQTGRQVTFDFGAGASKIITEVKHYQNTAGSHGTWKLQGSGNGSTWTDIGSTFTLGAAATDTYDFSGNSTGYRYYRLQQVSGTTTSGPYVHEIEFKIADAA